MRAAATSTKHDLTRDYNLKLAVCKTLAIVRASINFARPASHKTTKQAIDEPHTIYSYCRLAVLTRNHVVLLCSNKLEHCTAAQQNAQPPPLHFCRTDNILRTSGAAEANLDRRPLRAAEDEHAADQPRVARCVEINCNALHAIDAMGSMAWDSLVYLRTGPRCPAGSSAATCYWSSPTVRTTRRSSEPEAHMTIKRERLPATCAGPPLKP